MEYFLTRINFWGPDMLTGTPFDEYLKEISICKDLHQAQHLLHRIRLYLDGTPYEMRISTMKIRTEKVLQKLLRKQKAWRPYLEKEFTSIVLQYFDISPFRKCPQALLIEIFSYLSIFDISKCMSVCTEWHNTLKGNEVWFPLYERKFLGTNPTTAPQSLSSAKIAYKSEYHSRLLDPAIGDLVEVAWRGKFRLETQDIYQGLAWWAAIVVDKMQHANILQYKIHYPGWDSRWDEWVPRPRLRWVASSNAEDALQAGDVVELWCSGHNVPGAWLECVIKYQRHGSYCLGKVLSQGFLWVSDRQRLRLVSRNGVLRTGRGTGHIALGQQQLGDAAFATIDQQQHQQQHRRSSNRWLPSLPSVSTLLRPAVQRMRGWGKQGRQCLRRLRTIQPLNWGDVHISDSDSLVVAATPATTTDHDVAHADHEFLDMGTIPFGAV